MPTEDSELRTPEPAPKAEGESEARASETRRKRRNWGIWMIILTVVAVGLLLWSALTPYEGTLVELRLIASRVDFEIWPDHSLDHPDRSSLLAPGVQARSLLLESDRGLERRIPPPGLALPTLESDSTARYRILARDGESPFHPQLEVALPVSMTVEAMPTVPRRPQRLAVTLRRAHSSAPSVTSGDGSGDGAPAVPADGERAHPPSLRFSIGDVDLLLGQDFNDARMGLSMARHVNAESTMVQVLSLEQQGEVVSEFPLALQLPDSWRLIPNGGQALLLRKIVAGKQPLLQPMSDVRNLSFDHSAGGRLESYLLDSEVRFPDGELDPIPLPSGFFLDIDPEDAFSVRSFDRVPQGLAVTLWGQPVSVRAGPSSRYLRQILPSKLVWFHHRWKKLLIGGILLWALSTAFTIIKIIKP